MIKVIVKYNQQTNQAIVLLTDDEGNKYFLTNQGEWQICLEAQPQGIIENVLLYDQDPTAWP